MKTAQRK